MSTRGVIISTRDEKRAAELRKVQQRARPRTVIGTPDDRALRNIRKDKPVQAESFITYLSGVATVLVNLMRSVNK